MKLTSDICDSCQRWLQIIVNAILALIIIWMSASMEIKMHKLEQYEATLEYNQQKILENQNFHRKEMERYHAK